MGLCFLKIKDLFKPVTGCWMWPRPAQINWPALLKAYGFNCLCWHSVTCSAEESTLHKENQLCYNDWCLETLSSPIPMPQTLPHELTSILLLTQFSRTKPFLNFSSFLQTSNISWHYKAEPFLGFSYFSLPSHCRLIAD